MPAALVTRGALAGAAALLAGCVGVAPDGVALPCHNARDLPGLNLPNVRDVGLADIWRTSHGVTGNFKRLLHWSQRVARDTHGREHVELSDVYEAARLFPCYIDR